MQNISMIIGYKYLNNFQVLSNKSFGIITELGANLISTLR